jgi:hypothetical protein
LTKNISRGGIFIEIEGDFRPGQLIKLIIPGTKIDKGVVLLAEVVHLSLTGIGVKYKSLLKRRDFIRDRGGTRSGTDRRKMSIAEYSPERRSGKDRRKGGDRRRFKNLKYRKGINLSSAFRDLD